MKVEDARFLVEGSGSDTVSDSGSGVRFKLWFRSTFSVMAQMKVKVRVELKVTLEVEAKVKVSCCQVLRVSRF